MPHFVEHGFEALQQKRLALPRRHDLQSEPNLKDRHRCCPNRRPCLPIEPPNDVRIGRLAHQRREYVSIEDYHGSNELGLSCCPRNSAKSERIPIFENRLEISLPSPIVGTSRSLAALRRMSRTSSSMLRP